MRLGVWGSRCAVCGLGFATGKSHPALFSNQSWIPRPTAPIPTTLGGNSHLWQRKMFKFEVKLSEFGNLIIYVPNLAFFGPNLTIKPKVRFN